MTRRIPLQCAVVLCAFLFVAATADSASALTRAEANRIALAALKPSKQQGRVVVFGMPAPLGANKAVTTATAQRMGYRPSTTARDPKLGRRAWLFWMDLAHDAKYEHPSVMLLVDDMSGRIVKRKQLLWYPLINGVRPAFVNLPGYHAKRFQVWSNLTGASTARATISTRAELAISPQAFKDDCMISIGLTRDPGMAKDFTSMHAFAKRVGVRSFYAGREGLRGDPGGGVLQQNIDYLVETEKCKDILIYTSAHGAKAPAPASLQIGTAANGASILLKPRELRIIMDEHPKTTFKIKIDACYAGRFADELKDQHNLLVLEGSSSSTEVSWMHLKNARNSKGDKANPQVPNPGRSEFTHANITGMTRFVESLQEVVDASNRGGSLFAQMLARSVELGKLSDSAQITGRTHPVLINNLTPPPISGLEASHTHPEGQLFSYVCARFQSRPGASVVVRGQGPGGYDQSGTLELPLKNEPFAGGSFTFQITQAGTYTITVTSNKNGFTSTESVQYEVPNPPPGGAAQGPFACAP